MGRRRRPNYDCNRPKQIVYPVKENVVHCCSQETVKHVHPSHTTVVNHHLIKNKHVFPHTTSEKDTVESVDVAGNSFNGPGGMGSHHHQHHQHQYGHDKCHCHQHGHGKCHCKNKHKW